MNSQSLQPTLNPPQIPVGYLNLMGYVNESAVNGPGCRAVVWMQGCSRHCPDCFNPESWSFELNQLILIEDLALKILSNPRNTGAGLCGDVQRWGVWAYSVVRNPMGTTQ